MRLIDADKFMRDIRQRAYLTDNIVERPIYAMTVLGIQQTVDEQPTISPDEVRGVGEWIVKQTAIGKDYTVCSACETDFKFKTDKGTLARLDMRGMPYCPSCGARLGNGGTDDS